MAGGYHGAMKVLLASPRGFCAGVNMAIESLDLALESLAPPTLELFRAQAPLFYDPHPKDAAFEALLGALAPTSPPNGARHTIERVSPEAARPEAVEPAPRAHPRPAST